MNWMLVWFAWGAVVAPWGYAVTLAHFQRKFPSLAVRYHTSDVLFAMFVGGAGLVCPPAVVFALIIVTRGGLLYGCQWR